MFNNIVLLALLVQSSLAAAGSGDVWELTTSEGNGSVTTGITLSEEYVSNLKGRVPGWVETPNCRGTLDIIWTCLFTIFICTYTMLCLNVPSLDDKWWKIIGRKTFWVGVAIAGPEFVLTAACGQYGTARDSVKLFHELGYKTWTLRHGFFADMGGFLVIPRKENPHDRPFPVTAKQLHWLVTHNYLSFPQTSNADIGDKSKQDTLTRILTTAQISYLVLQCIGRAVQNLAITSLELFTLAIVVCSILTNIVWLRKPLDVNTPVKLKLNQNASIGDIRRYMKLEIDNWQHTPLDFVDDLRPSWNFNVQEFMKIPLPPYHEHPVSRFGNDRLPNLDDLQKLYLCFATLGYAAIHLAGWNWSFPTYLELILWRVSSLFIFGTTGVFWLFETIAAWHRRGRWSRIFPKRLSRMAGTVNPDPNLGISPASSIPTPTKRKQLPLPAEFWSILPLAILYGAARCYLVVEVFWGLRSLEASAYLTVDWTSFIPHV